MGYKSRVVCSHTDLICCRDETDGDGAMIRLYHDVLRLT